MHIQLQQPMNDYYKNNNNKSKNLSAEIKLVPCSPIFLATGMAISPSPPKSISESLITAAWAAASATSTPTKDDRKAAWEHKYRSYNDLSIHIENENQTVLNDQ